ncbi:MAG: hypothetical protein HOG15_14955 [Anaerolineae bacterium]|nr:hypothetical protein [Anaerolineae bacterium]MBT4309132.1 hypothetical protein [Anaerolineae bacterium]
MDLANHIIHMENGKLKGTSRDDVRRIFELFKEDESTDTLLLHMHGGLVAKTAAEKTAGLLVDKYLEAGAYPVFFVWESFATETIVNNASEIIQEDLKKIFDEKFFKRLLLKVAQFMLAKVGVEGGDRGERLELTSEHEIQRQIDALAVGEDILSLGLYEQLSLEELSTQQEAQFRESLEDDMVFTMEAAAIGNSIRPKDEIEEEVEISRGGFVPGSTQTLMSPDLLEEIREDSPRKEERGTVSVVKLLNYSVQILAKVVKRFLEKRDHGLYTTIIEEILREFYVAAAGKFLWDHMKKDTADSFQDNAEVFGGSAFLDELGKMWESGDHPRLVLVGHSAGTVYISHLLKYADERLPNEIRFDLVFLASAVTCELFAKTVQDHGHRINEIRQFGMSDALEKADHLVPVIPVYSYSLLYLISGILEDKSDKPLVGMQRYHEIKEPFLPGSVPDVDIIRKFFTESKNRTVWSESDLGPGLNTTGKKHGAFDDEDAPTLESIQHIIKEGF